MRLNFFVITAFKPAVLLILKIDCNALYYFLFEFCLNVYLLMYIYVNKIYNSSHEYLIAY